jgi:SET domain-containing protein
MATSNTVLSSEQTKESGLSKRGLSEELRPYDLGGSVSNFDIGVYSKVMVRKSTIQGLGCFAISLIPEGTLIAEYIGEIIDIEEAIRRNDCSSKDYSHYILTINERLFIDGAHAGNKSRFINHSCQPNCGVLRVEPRAFIVARRTISRSEELTIDYDYDADVRQPCFCGALKCRGYI